MGLCGEVDGRERSGLSRNRVSESFPFLMLAVLKLVRLCLRYLHEIGSNIWV